MSDVVLHYSWFGKTVTLVFVREPMLAQCEKGLRLVMIDQQMIRVESVPVQLQTGSEQQLQDDGRYQDSRQYTTTLLFQGCHKPPILWNGYVPLKLLFICKPDKDVDTSANFCVPDMPQARQEWDMPFLVYETDDLGIFNHIIDK